MIRKQIVEIKDMAVQGGNMSTIIIFIQVCLYAIFGKHGEEEQINENC